MTLYGYLLIWPLYVASASAESGSTQGLWIQEKLEYVSNVMGFGRLGFQRLGSRRNPGT
jgi:hypothetical protein